MFFVFHVHRYLYSFFISSPFKGIGKNLSAPSYKTTKAAKLDPGSIVLLLLDHSIFVCPHYVCSPPWNSSVSDTWGLDKYWNGPFLYLGYTISKQLCGLIFKEKDPLNLPIAFWGLLGPRKDVTVDFIKTVSEFLSFWYHWHGQRSPWGPKRPQKVKCVSFLVKQ